MTDRVGQLLGNYYLTQLLGQGGFADVYLGQHRYLHSYAAIKLLRKTLNDADEQQFLKEAQTLVRLKHAHIVRVLDFAVEQGTPMLIMEYAHLGTLRQRYPVGSRLSLATTVDFVLQIASALQYAHNHHVIHRDVKPENILLTNDGQLLLSDFGLSLFSVTPALLSTQPLAGTLPYTAPEQLRGKPCFASDQYALGIIAYEWITGKRPFEGNIWEVVQQHLECAPAPLRTLCPQLAPAVEAVILKALAKDPQDRFVSVQGFTQALVRASEGHLHEEANDLHITAPFKAVLHSSLSGPTLVSLPSRTPVPSQPQVKYPTPTPRNSNRERLLAKVHAFWIKGVLEHSLHGAALMTVGLCEQPEAVANPWRLVLQQPDLAPQRLPSGTHITQVYDDAEGELLILGEPGSGKTTLLLELARDLLNRAEQDESHPIPVVFHLSSWAATQRPFTSWLIEELNSKYQVPHKLAEQWVKNDQVLPLLDGFDEITAPARIACLHAINAYRQEHGLLSTVVCSRSADYLALSSPLQLSTAVVVQPLTAQQVDDYLISGGEPLWALRVALHQDAALRELTSSPLLLSILTLTYHGMPVEDLLREASPTDRQRQVLERYVDRMLKRRGAETRYTKEQTVGWLTYLARQMQQHNQAVFYIERMQPDWLEDHRSRRHYPGSTVGFIFALIGSLGLGPAGGQMLLNLLPSLNLLPKSTGELLSFILFLGLALLFGLVSGSLFGLVNAVLFTQDTEARPTTKLRGRQSRTPRRIAGAVLNGVLVGLLVGLPYGLSLGLRLGDVQSWTLLSGGFAGLLGALAFGLVDGLLDIQTTVIRPAETFIWSWKKMWLKLVKFLCLGLLSSLLIGLLPGVVFVLYEWKIGHAGDVLATLPGAVLNGLPYGLLFAPFFALIGGLLGGLTGGLSSEILDERKLTLPNQGIRRSFRHSLLVGVVAGMVGGIVGGVFGGIVSQVHDPNVLWSLVLSYGLIIGPVVGLISGLRAGGMACIQHVILRWLLWKRESMPWHYPHFLDYSTEHVLLRKVGGGYIFIHRLLLEYFASLEAPFSTKV